MAATLVATVAASTTGSTYQVLTFTLPSTVLPGDRLLVVIAHGDQALTPSLAFTAVSSTGAVSGTHLYQAYYDVGFHDSTLAGTAITFAPAATDAMVAVLFVIRGALAYQATQLTVAGFTSATSHATTSLTASDTPSDGELWHLVAAHNTGTVSTPVGVSAVHSAANSSGLTLSVFKESFTALGTTPVRTITASVAGTWAVGALSMLLPTVSTRRSNDDRSGAFAVSSSTTFSLQNATSEAAEANPFSRGVLRSVWFTYTPATTGRYRIAVTNVAAAVEVSAFDRSTLRIGIDKPDASTTGLLPEGTTTTVSGNSTFSTNGETISNTLFNGRVSITAKDVTFRNCRFRGDNSASALVSATSINVERLAFIDCEIDPQFVRNDQNGFDGHDATFTRVNMHHTVDCAHIQNGAQYGATGAGWVSGVRFEQSWLHDFGWWTAATAGIVHPSDTETHNDLIQIFGGSGTEIVGCRLDSAFARQYGHWQVTNPDVEPYTTVALHSRGDGGPFQAIPNRGTGTLATGRYNWDDCAGLMIDSSQGPATDFLVTDNWCYGGNFFVNGGGNPYSSGLNLGHFLRNKFSRDQGNQGSGSGNGHTLDFGGTWSGHVTAPTTGDDANVYEDDSTPITVRF